MPSDSDVLSELDLEDPPQELLDYAKKEVNEDQETSCQVLEEFRDLIFGKCPLFHIIKFIGTWCLQICNTVMLKS